MKKVLVLMMLAMMSVSAFAVENTDAEAGSVICQSELSKDAASGNAKSDDADTREVIKD